VNLDDMDQGKNAKVQTANVINYLAAVVHKLTGGQPWIAFDTDEILKYAGEQGIEGIEVELRRTEDGREEVVLTYITSRPTAPPPKRRGFQSIEGGKQD
jgi:hypothetical protein